MSIYIYLRKTEDWENTNYDTLSFPTWHKNRSSVVRTIWSQCFEKTYCHFRGELKKICMGKWKYPVIVEDVDELRATVKDDDWVLTSDDDDFYHPDIGNLLEQCDAYEVVHWDSICNQTAYNYSIHAWHSCHTNPCSNSYALRGSIVRRNNNEAMKLLLEDHNMIMIRADKMDFKWKSFPKTQMSVYNWHIGSISLLMSIEDCPERMSVVIPRNEPSKMRPEWHWANDGMSQIIELVKDMKPRESMKFL